MNRERETAPLRGGAASQPFVGEQTDTQQDNELDCQPLEANLEEWASFTAGLHFRDDLVRMVRLRSEARRRAVQRQRADAAVAAARLEPLPDTADEVEIRGETAVLYNKLTRLVAAGKLRWDDHKSTWVARPIYTTRTDSTRPPSYTVEELLSRFDKVRRHGKGWIARCAAHEDKRPSLAITQGDKGWLIKCWAHCDFRDIVTAAGLEPQRMFYA